MSGDLYFGTYVIASGDFVYLDSDETTRVYNDGGTLKLQKYESGSWVDYQTWGA